MKELNERLQKIEAAHERLQSIITETPLIESVFFTTTYGAPVLLKPENLQRTGAFKIRGAYNRIALLSEKERQKGIVTASAGNHAQGVAYAARSFGCPCTIVMPQVTPLIKIESAREKGANVVIHGQQYDDAYAKAMAIADEQGATFVHAYDDADIIDGQGTIALEMLKEAPDLEEIIVPVGGGGLVSGIALAAKALKPDIIISGVEPEGAASMRAAWAQGEPQALEAVSTCAEGVAVKKAGQLTTNITRRYVDRLITVSEAQIMEAVLVLLEKHKLVCEASGALPLAALKKLRGENRKVGCVISGGNIDMVTISSMITNGLLSRGRIFIFSVELPDSPGQLLAIAKILADEQANVIELVHNQFKAMERYHNKVVLEVTIETNGFEHVERVMNTLRQHGYEPRTGISHG